jgi:WD40 repeat protein
MNPFPGLRPFTQEEDYLFFGREEQTLELLARLDSQHFVAVVGASGSGKSSLVRCGLLSELLGGKMRGAGASWEITVTHPGGNPLALLTDALLDVGLYDREAESTRENLLATLSRSHFGLVEAVKQAGLGGGTNFLLVVDQFEEIFRFREAGQTQQEAANEFVSILLEAAAQREVPIYVVLTMRSDFIGECGQFEGLAETVNRGEFLIPRLSREQYKRVIEGPIKVAGGQIAPRLLQRLLNDLGQEADQLPCLQHAMMRTWNVWTEKEAADLSAQARTLDLDDYQRVGKMSQALSLHADEIYDALATDRERQLCRGLFQALTVQESEGRGIRRPQRLGRLCQILNVTADELAPIIDAYRRPGVTFLMPSQEVELTDRTIIDISHESLMRVWTRLRHWVGEEAQAAGIYLRLSESAALHGQSKAGLYRDPELGIALAWQVSQQPNAAWAERYRPGFEAAMAFLTASQEASVAEEQAREAARQRELEQARQLAEAQQLRLEQQQRSAGKLRKMIAGLAAVAVIAVLACALALVARHEASRLAEVAEQEADKARKNEDNARQHAKRAEQAQKETAIALAEADQSLSKARAAERLRAVAEDENRKLLYMNDMRLAPLVLNDDPATAEQLRLLLARHIPAGQPAGTKEVLPPTADLRGFEWYYHQHLLEDSARVFAGHGVSIIDGAFTPNGQLVTLDQNGQVRRWNPSSQDKDDMGRRDLPGGASAQVRVLSPDGRLAALAKGNEVHVFDTATGKKTCQIESADVASRRLIFSRDEGRLVIADNKIRLCDAVNGAVIASVDHHSDGVSSLALSADALTLAVVGQPTPGKPFSIFHFDVIAKSVTPLATAQNFYVYGGPFDASALSPDGQRIALGWKQNGTVTVIDTTTGRQIAAYGTYTSPPIATVAFSGDGAQLATADTQGTIKIWDARGFANGRMQRTLRGHQGAIHSIGFSSDGKQLISTSLDKTARVWDLEIAGTAMRPLEGVLNNFNNRSLGARFSPDGLWIAAAGGAVQQQQVWDAAAGRYNTVASTGGGVQVWDAATGRLVRKLPAGGKSGTFSIAFSPTDSRLLAVGHGGQTGDSYVSLWDIDSGKEMARLAGATDLPDKKTAVGAFWIGALAFSPDGKYLVAGFGSKDMYSAFNSPLPLTVWEVASRRLIHRLNGHTSFCIALDFSSEGKLLASGSRDGTAILWSTATWNSGHILKNPDARTLQGQGMVEDVAFAPDGKTLAMASREGNVHLWDVAAGNRLETLRGHVNAVQALAFSPDGRTLATAGMDRTFRLWNVQMRRELMQLDPGQLNGVLSLAFSPDGKHLLAGGFGSGLWSAAPNIWDDVDLAAAKLGLLLKSNADFPSRIRMASENNRLHEALAKLDPQDARVRAALAATRANWHASQQRWAEAAGEFDRLPEPRPDEVGAWLRTPGLVRLATALVHQNRTAEATMLLLTDAKSRDQDGLPPISRAIGFGFTFNVQGGVVRVAGLMPGSSASGSKLLPFDVIVKVNDVEIKNATLPDFTKMLAGGVGTKLRLTVRHQGNQTEDVDLVKEISFDDDATGSLFSRLHAALAKRLAKDPRDAGLLELRAELELAGKDTDFASQAAQLTAVIKVLAEQPVSAPLRRLYRRRGDVYVALEKWAEAVDDYAHVITPQTTDVVLLSNRARALEGVKQWDAAAADWTRVAAGDAEGAKCLAEFARRLGAGGQVSLAKGQYEKSQALYERALAGDRGGDPVAAELAQLLLDKDDYATRWMVLKATEVKSEGGSTLTKLEDHSILANGKNPPHDTYTLTFRDLPAKIHALGLEVLPHESLPVKGPGRHAGGNFHLTTVKAELELPTNRNQPRFLKLSKAAADFNQAGCSVSGVVDADDKTSWGIYPAVGKPHLALLELAEPALAGDGAVLRVTLEFKFFPQANLGRFRLSVSADQGDFDREQKRFAATRLTDPWAKLAAGYALDGRLEEALRYFSLALKRADDSQARGGIIEFAALFEDILVALGQRHPDDAQLQFALARKLAVQGRTHLAAKKPAQAQAELEQARAVFQRLLASGGHWKTLAPVEMKTEAGATMEIQKDGSVFVRQNKTPKNDTYTLVFQSDLKGVKGLRLEVLTDPRLPQGGPGWGSNGNFHLNELALQAAPVASPDKARSIALRNAWADHSEVTGVTGDSDVRGAVDGNRNGAWSIWPQVNKDHTAVFDTAEPVGDGLAWRLTVRLSHRSNFPDHNLGRFRLSFTNDAATLLEARRLLNPPDSEWVELDVALVKGYAQQGQTKEAAVALARALEQAPDRRAKAALLAEAEAWPGLLPKLSERAEGQARVLAALAQHFADKGDKPLANAARTKARALFEKQLTVEPDKAALASELADLLWSTFPPVDYFWIDDAVPPGAIVQGDPWEFVGPPDHPVFRGKKSTLRQAQGIGQHYFLGVAPGLKIGPGARLFAHVFLDPQDPPKTIMLQFNDGSIWEHRAFWGDDLIPWGNLGAESRLSMGPLPKAGGWVRLEVDASKVGLDAGRVLRGWSFAQHGGTCYWDAAGTTLVFDDPWQSLAAAYHRLDDQQALATLLKQHPAATAGIGDLYAANQDWQRAIAEYRKAATDQPDDANLLAKRVTAYLSLAQSANEARQFAASARALAEALQVDPKLADDRQKQHRYDAACAAALAAAGQGQDEPPLDDLAKAKLRRQALDWLKAEHTAWDKLIEPESPGERQTAASTLSRWQKDASLIGIRDSAALAKLSAEERAAFTQLWSDVAALMKKAESEYGKETAGVQVVGQGLVLRGNLDAQTRALIYRVKLEAANTYVIEMLSPPNTVRSCLLVRDAAGKLLRERQDPMVPGLARILFHPDQDGAFRIQAASNNAANAAFTFTVRPLGAKEVGGVQAVGKGLFLNGRLDAQTGVLLYRMKLEAGKTYVIDMVSPNGNALDPYLLLRDAAGKHLAEDDDSGGGQNARITFRAEQGGVYHIQATSYNSGSGDFTLTVREQLLQPKGKR